jgi:thiol-disulfide isomerase/thioredoxin
MSFLKLNGGGDNYMSKLKNFTSSISIKTIVILLSILIFIGACIYIYNSKFKSKVSTSYSANNEHTNENNKTSQAELLLFYADWCPHCKTAKPIWEELKTEYEVKTINGYTILFTDVNCTTESPEVEKLMNTYKVEGFPTIKLLKDGQVIEYDAKVTKSTLEQFLNTVL